jgi:hypothetical protein
MGNIISESNEQELNRAQLGDWEIVGLSGVTGTHAALLHTSQVIFFTRPEEPSHKWNNLDNGLPGDNQLPSCTRDACAPDVTLSAVVEISGPNAFKPVPVQVTHNPFCAGQAFLADGRLLVAGGDKKQEATWPRAPKGTRYGLNSLRVFTPHEGSTGEWKSIGKISSSRWYPTCTLLPDGRVFLISGSLDDQEVFNNQNPTCEVIPPLPGGPQYLPFLAEAWPYHSYPFVFVLPDGRLFVFAKDSAYYLTLKEDAFARERWHVEDGPKLTGQPAKHYPNTATAVLLPLLPEKDYAAEVLLMGGGGANIYRYDGQFDIDAVNSCFRLDVDTPGAQWRCAAHMKHRRVMPDAVLLPDGAVLVVNGVSKGFGGGNAANGTALPENAVTEAELYDPVNNEWKQVAVATCTRLYHSTALLLPDATVLVAGSDQQVHNRGLPANACAGLSDIECEAVRNRHYARGYEYRLEVFSPPYLFKGIPRPVIESVQGRIRYGEGFDIQVQNLPEMRQDDLKVALLRPGSVTHCNNTGQRHVGLKILRKSDTHLTIEAPPDSTLAPPGYYMLFLLHQGVPSVAPFVQLILEPSDKAANPAPSGKVNPRPPSDRLALWLRADTGIVADASSLVSSWADLSGQGNDVFSIAEQDIPLPIITGVQRPRWVQNELNGHAVVRFYLVFDEVRWTQVWGTCLESGNKRFLPGSDPYTVFLVTHPWPPGHGIEGMGGRGDLVGWGNFNQPDSNAYVGLRLGPGPRDRDLPLKPGNASITSYWKDVWRFGNDATDPLVPLSRAVLLEASFDGAFLRLRMNGSLIKEDRDQDKNIGDGPVMIGRNGARNGAFFRGDIAEILMYDRAMDDQERTVIQGYLRTRYALW